ncbi:MAG: hypothetical protein ICV59_01465 [Thermoleophilia bacterium]|nr:hypothetical protein [Thermoleophilia bacterium]
MGKLVAVGLALALPLAATAANARVLRTTTTVEGLAADGATTLVATAWARGSCERVLAWNPVRPTLRAYGSRICPETSTGRAIVDVALAGNRAAWVQDVGGNQREASLYVAPVSRPRAARRLALARRDADSRAGDYIGSLESDGSLLVYERWSVCNFGSCPPGALSGQPYDVTVRIVNGASGRAVFTSPRDDLQVVDVAAGRILVQRGGGDLEVWNSRGVVISKIPYQYGAVLQAALGPADLVVFFRVVPPCCPDPAPPVELAMHVYDPLTGALKRTLPVPKGASGARPRCIYPGGASPAACRVPRARPLFQDVDGGLLVYVLDTTVHVVRLADGREQRFGAAGAAPVFAELEPAGLFYSYRTTTRLKGRVQFVPRSELRLR